jgi:hypothetical protein
MFGESVPVRTGTPARTSATTLFPWFMSTFARTALPVLRSCSMHSRLGSNAHSGHNAFSRSSVMSVGSSTPTTSYAPLTAMVGRAAWQAAMAIRSPCHFVSS